MLKEDGRFTSLPEIKKQINYLGETRDDTEIELECSKDQDAKVGHKTADTSFFEYKTHIAMTLERIITVSTITAGEKYNGKQLQTLIEKSNKNCIEVNSVIVDGAYSEKENLDYCSGNNIKNVSILSKSVTHGNGKYGTQVEYCYFDVGKCKHCSIKNGCYKDGTKTKTFSVKIKNDTYIKHMDYMETEKFKALYKERYNIETKNAELKNNYGYDKANACGKLGITIQGATTLFLADMKRIIKLNEEKNKNI